MTNWFGGFGPFDPFDKLRASKLTTSGFDKLTTSNGITENAKVAQ